MIGGALSNLKGIGMTFYGATTTSITAHAASDAEAEILCDNVASLRPPMSLKCRGMGAVE